MNLKQLSESVHLANAKRWQDVETGLPIKRNKGELLALIHSEVSEWYEGQDGNLMDDKLPHRKMGEVESADSVIRILDYAKGFGHDIQAAGLKFGISEFLDLNHFILCADKKCLEYQFPTFQKIHLRISQVLELERKGRPSDQVAEALVVLLIHIFSRARMLEYDLQGAFDEKTAFNAQREDHKHEARRIAGGKQF